MQKLSKAAIYCLHRGELQEARAKLSHAHKLALAFLPLISEFQHLRKGTFSSAIEEFVEGKAFEYFLLHGKLVPMADHELKGLCDAEEYLGEFDDVDKEENSKLGAGGIADLCGELTRFAVLRATVRDKAAVQRCAKLGDDILM